MKKYIVYSDGTTLYSDSDRTFNVAPHSGQNLEELRPVKVSEIKELIDSGLDMNDILKLREKGLI